MSELEKFFEEVEKNRNDFEKLMTEIKKVYPGADAGQNTGPHLRWISCFLKGRYIEIRWQREQGFVVCPDPPAEDPPPGSEEQDVTYLDIQGVMSCLGDLSPKE